MTIREKSIGGVDGDRGFLKQLRGSSYVVMCHTCLKPIFPHDTKSDLIPLLILDIHNLSLRKARRAADNHLEGQDIDHEVLIMERKAPPWDEDYDDWASGGPIR